MLISILLMISAYADPTPSDLDRYVKLYWKASHLMQTFDQELAGAQPGHLQNSDTYKKLLSVRAQKDEIIHRFATSSPVLDYSESDLPAIEDFVENYNDHFPSRAIALPSASANKDRNEDFYLPDLDLFPFSRFETFTSNRIEPGIGSSGNVSGYQFPERTWALTYDDGPHVSRTQEILTILENHSVKATFFWLAQNVMALPNVVQLAKDRGMSLQNHSFTHANLPKISDAGLQKEIAESTQIQTSFYGERPKFFRCPYGAGLSNSKIRQKIADEQMIHVFWNVDSLDWQDKNPQSILQRVQAQMKKEKKGIILFHDIHAQTVETSKLLLESAAMLPDSQSIRWVTLPEIVDELNKK